MRAPGPVDGVDRVVDGGKHDGRSSSRVNGRRLDARNNGELLQGSVPHDNEAAYLEVTVVDNSIICPARRTLLVNFAPTLSPLTPLLS
jgi:hypothetical protein